MIARRHVAWVLIAAACSAAAANELTLEVRGSSSGAWLEAELQVEDQRLSLPRAGGRVELGEEPARVLISSPGHEPLLTTLGGPDQLPTTVWLDPAADRSERVGSGAPLAPGFGRLAGHVYDAFSGQPLAGAVLSLEWRGLAAVSDLRGRFVLDYPFEPHNGEELPPVETLAIACNGYRSQRREGLVLSGGRSALIIDLEPGRGEQLVAPTHKMLNLDQPTQIGTAWEPPGPDTVSKVLAPVGPPASIKLGTSCSCTSCSSVSVLSLETYVKRGLNDEWIASWNAESLKAGSVAYRSYGSWYVEHPISASYDICNTTCCQVNDSDTSTASDLAVEATAGFLLERWGEVFRSEYSAENNAWNDPADGLSCSNSDLSCGDGAAGSPAAGWSCLADALCAGHGCFGHGRGMCQWGTQRWATTGAQSWSWIVNHYYNDHGAGIGSRNAAMTTPLWIDSVAPDPSFVAAGGSFTIEVEAHNAASLDHQAVLIGASLYSTATGYIDDPAHDQPVTLVPGSSTVSRSFTVPPGAPSGHYDLLVSLYYDVNGDGSISPADLGLVLEYEAAALEVVPVALIFADDFEHGEPFGWTEP